MAFGYVSRTPQSASVRSRRLAALIEGRELEALYRDYAIRYLVIPTGDDPGAMEEATATVAFEDADWRILDLAPR
jgi:hypothetical protein